jgi:calpain-5
MKADVDDFWKILSEPGEYTDEDFKASTESLLWKDWGEKNQWSNMDIGWKRATELNYSPKSLWGDGISVDDINQGYIGNCWFMAAASAVAEVPGRLESVFLNTESDLNSQGIYAVNFYALGVPHSVVIDDQLPISGGGLVMA